MSQDSEKRFHSIMDKLFLSPNSSPSSTSSPSLQYSRGKKRLHSASALSIVDPNSSTGVQPSTGASQAPMCRPWDRADLMKRLSTFKAMTWFAKPKVVSAVNCARRGWINVDEDTIACETCGARLLFSSPSSWSREQVDKAALVFSLKLDNAHKLLCPWTDNACDETLAQFPPMPPPALVELFRERASLLVQLFALPVVSSSAIDLMSSPQLDQFLQESSALEHCEVFPNISLTKVLGNVSDMESVNLYYQVLNLISLCGWEPHLLPYVVDCNRSNQIVKDANISSQQPDRDSLAITVSCGDISGGREGDSDQWDSSEVLADPKSVVLDCNLCGASVGLWPFITVPRPIELFRLVGDTVSGNHVDRTLTIPLNVPSSRESSSNLTIAGGPPPTRQNFKAKISLPVIGRNIRARFASDCDLRKHILVSQKNNPSQSISTLALQSNGGRDQNLSDTSENGALVLLEEGSTQDVDVQGLTHNNTAEETEDIGLASSDSINAQNTSGMLIEWKEGLSGENRTSGSALISDDVDIREHESPYDAQNVLASQVNADDGSKDKEMKRNSLKVNLLSGNSDKNSVLTASSVFAGKHSNLQPVDKGMEFDLIRQHRHFCPWIVSTSGGVPGWQQVLSALQRQKVVSRSSPTSPPATSFLKVDDPVTSVRRLFSSKRMKPS